MTRKAFAPAPTGWRAVYVYEDASELGHEFLPVAGWLTIEAESLYDDPSISVRAAVINPESPAELMAVDDLDDGMDPTYHRDFWKILGPGEPEPTGDDIAQYRTQEQGRIARYVERQKKREAEKAAHVA